MTPEPESAAHDLVLTRSFDAPRALVFKAWTDPKQLAQWWGPHGFTTPVCEADARPGGALYLEMRGPAGSDYEGPYPMWGTFIEVLEPERLVFSAVLKNDEGVIFLENLNTVTFTEHDGTTLLTLNVRVITAGPEAAGPLAGMSEGWSQSLERLQTYVGTVV